MVPITDDEIEVVLERMFVADAFKSSPKLRQFLRYIVTQKLEGKDDQLKAYSIAIDVYNYPVGFDPQNDPIIRVQARRLRTALKEYYLDAGVGERIVITVPRGGYRPVFSENLDLDEEEQLRLTSPNVEGSAKPDRRYIMAGLMAFLLIIGLGFGWLFWGGEVSNIVDHGSDTITVAMRHDNLSLSEAKDSEEAIFFSRNLRSSMARNSALSIILPAESGSDKNEINGETDFIIDTSVLVSDSVRSVSIELVNGHTDKLVWSRSHKISDIEDDTVFQIVRELNSEIFGASVQALEGREPKSLSASQLFVLATWVPGPAKSTLEWEKERIELARLALKKDPEFGPAYSVLADKLAYLAAVDGPSDTEEAAKEAKASAARALELSAGDVNALFNVAQYYWHSGQLDSSIAMMKRVLELDPSHGFAHFFSIVIPYTCSPAPDDALDAVVEFDQSLGADNPARWVTLTWLGWLHLNRDEFSAALEAEEYSAQIFQIPYTIIRHAAILNLLDRTEDAAELLESQKSNWPNLNPEHFAKVTFPRICSERENSEKIVGFYTNLEKSMDTYSIR